MRDSDFFFDAIKKEKCQFISKLQCTKKNVFFSKCGPWKSGA